MEETCLVDSNFKLAKNGNSNFWSSKYFDNASAKRDFQAKAYKVTTKLNLFHVALSNFIKDHILLNKCL